jgi:hypothetical protein
MPLLAELVAFYVIVAIKISLLRSWESHPLNQARKQIRFFNPAPARLGYFDAPEAVPFFAAPPIRRFAPFAHSCILAPGF